MNKPFTKIQLINLVFILHFYKLELVDIVVSIFKHIYSLL